MLKCLNCKEVLGQGSEKLFLGVFVCSNCELFATRALERVDRDLHRLRTMASEAIRVSLIEGRLNFVVGEEVKEPGKADVLTALKQLSQQAGSS